MLWVLVASLNCTLVLQTDRDIFGTFFGLGYGRSCCSCLLQTTLFVEISAVQS